MSENDRRGRRSTDVGKIPWDIMGWLKANLSSIVAVASFVSSILFFAFGFYIKVIDMIPMVAQLRVDLDRAQVTLIMLQADLKATNEHTSELAIRLSVALDQAEALRAKLNETDGKASEMIARMDERIKGLENHAVPLPFYAPGKGPPR